MAPPNTELVHLATVMFSTDDIEPYGSVMLYINNRCVQEFDSEVALMKTIIMRRIYVSIPVPLDHDDLQYVEWVMRGILHDCQQVHHKYVTAWTFSDEWRDLSTTLKGAMQ